MQYSIAAILAASAAFLSVNAATVFDPNARDPDWPKFVTCSVPGGTKSFNGNELFDFAEKYGKETTQIDGLYGSWTAKPTDIIRDGKNIYLQMDFEYYKREGKTAMSLTTMFSSYPHEGVSKTMS